MPQQRRAEAPAEARAAAGAAAASSAPETRGVPEKPWRKPWPVEIGSTLASTRYTKGATLHRPTLSRSPPTQLLRIQSSHSCSFPRRATLSQSTYGFITFEVVTVAVVLATAFSPLG